MIVTNQGMALNAKLATTKTVLQFVRAAIGTGGVPASDAYEMTALQQWYADLQGLSYTPPDPNSSIFAFSIQAQILNENVSESTYITEVGIFALDPDEGEILYGVELYHSAPLLINPPVLAVSGYGYAESHTFDLHVEVSRDLQIEICFVNSNYMTKNEADGDYWIIGEKYPATEITETTGETTEEAQRRQDERLRIIEDVLASGTTSSVTVDIDAYQPLKWKIMNYHGWYDAANSVYRA